MTKERAKRLLPVMTAYVEGRPIEVYDNMKMWKSISDPSFDEQFEYRIKPELRYVPYDESYCITGMVVRDTFGVRFLIVSQGKNFVVLSNEYRMDYEQLMGSYTFDDGSTIGQMRID